MTTETAHNSQNSISEQIRGIIITLFTITDIPIDTPSLITNSVKFSKEIILQLMLYGTRDQWKWYANQDKYCGDKKIDTLIEVIYIYIRKPEYNIDDELSPDLSVLYRYIIGRIPKLDESSVVVKQTEQKVGNLV